MRKKRFLSPKRVIVTCASLVAAFCITVLLNDAMGSQLPLPSAHEVEAAVSDQLDELYVKAGLSAVPVQTSGDLTVHFINVGQADCELIDAPGKTVLIDAGDVGGADALISYLHAQDVQTIDYLIATHPHADHIGNMDEIVNEFDIGHVIFSEIPASLTPTSKVYERLLDAITQKGLKITKASPGAQYDLGGGAVMTILGPLRQDPADLNENSVVCRLDYGSTSFLFTGDASKASEDDLIETYGGALQADVLKLGHHGSDTASQEEWLEFVRPRIAIASVGYDNSYGHPSPEVIQRLETFEIPLYRTDRDGTIVVSSDGQQLELQLEHPAA